MRLAQAKVDVVASTHFRGAVRVGGFIWSLGIVVASTHFRGAVRRKSYFSAIVLVVASTHFRGAVRSARATLLGCWAGRQKAFKKMGGG